MKLKESLRVIFFIQVGTKNKSHNQSGAKFIYEKTGIKNFLIGESLLKSDNPSELMKKLIQITQ